MDQGIAAILGAFGGAFVVLLAQKLWADMIPKGRVFTPARVFFGVLALVGLWGAWRLVQLGFGDDAIISALARIFLATSLMIAVGELATALRFRLLAKRIEAIEQHVGVSKP